jgi:hypothetical protein
MNLLKPVYMSAESLEQGTGLTVLGSIMHAPTDADVARSRTAKLWLMGGAALLIVAFIAVFVVSTADGGRFLEQLFG